MPERKHDFTAVSLLIEQATGSDSIPTIERLQFCDDGHLHDDYEACRRYHCVMPGCGHRTQGSQTMWIHEHFGEHGRSFDFTIRDLINALPSWPGADESSSSDSAGGAR